MTDSNLLNRARRMDRSAIEAIFAQNYPAVHRIAFGLSGRADVGRGVTRFVMKRALHTLPAWKDDDAPQRWFLHHTILTTRRARKHQPGSSNDVLIGDPQKASPEYVAFIRALRSLPFQQREAFVLRHGELLNERYSAVAMDCSVIAAANHLKAAADALGKISSGRFDDFTAEMSRIYRAQSPDQALTIPKLRRTIRRYVWPRKLMRIVGWIIILIFLAAIAWIGWKIWPNLEF